jgi:hypothetical protein
MPARKGKPPSAAPLEVVERELATAFPQARVVDRELEIAEGRSIDLVAVDAHGRVLLVSLVQEGGDASLLLALDALAFVRRNRDVLAHHLDHPPLRSEGPPLAVLVAERFSDALLARLEGLDPDRLRCLEIRTVASQSRTGTYLVPVLPAGERGQPVATRDPVDFLDQVPPERRDVAELLLRRLVRVDERLDPTVVDHSLTLRLDGELLCTLTLVSGEIGARVAGRDHTHTIAAPADIDPFVEEVLGRAHELIRTGDDPMVDVALDPTVPAGAILTPEEIEAFRGE